MKIWSTFIEVLDSPAGCLVPTHVDPDAPPEGQSCWGVAIMSKFMFSNDPIQAAKVANTVGGYVASQSGAIPDYSENVKALFQ